jgi:hypothetical protein
MTIFIAAALPKIAVKTDQGESYQIYSPISLAGDASKRPSYIQ